MQSTPPARTRNPWPALVVLCLGSFVILMDTTIVNVAVPDMLASLHAGLDQVLWILNAYLLTFAVLLVTAGRLGDILGQRTLFAAGLGVFSLASALCGLAQDPNQLIAARVLQGVGGAVLTPQSLVIVSSIFPADRRGVALGVVSAITGLAAISGPTLGGVIVTYLGWRWVFFVNVPIGIVGLVMTMLLVPDLRPGRQHRLDLVGVLLATVGLFGIVFGLIEGQRYDWGAIEGWAVTIPEVIGAGAALLSAFVVWERFQPEPLVPLGLFRDRTYSIMVWLNAVMAFALFGILLTTTIFYQSVLGMSPVQAGLTSLPMTLVLTVVGPFAGRLTDRIGGRWIIMLGLLLYAAGTSGVAWVASQSATWSTFTLPLIVGGIGMGCVFAPLMTEAMRRVPPALAGAASGTLGTSRQVGSAIGSAVIGAVLLNQLAASMHDRAVAASSQLPPSLRRGFVDAVSSAASQGLGAGADAGQRGAVVVPAGVPAHTARLVARLSQDVFTAAYTQSLRPTLAVAAAVLVIGALSCLAIARRRPASPRIAAEVAPDAASERRAMVSR